MKLPFSRTFNEKPILFNTEMVKAILEGRKTQTRRVIKDSFNGCWTNGGPHPCPNNPVVVHPGEVLKAFGEPDIVVDYTNVVEAMFHCSTMDKTARCPYGKIGDQLWVRETFYAYGRWLHVFDPDELKYVWTFEDLTTERELSYRYEENPPEIVNKKRKKDMARWYKRPSIFMPRQAARILLEITNIRVKRVQEITGYAALAEGIKGSLPYARSMTQARIDYESRAPGFISDFRTLWNSINEKRGFGWDINPWVWVVEFKRIEMPLSEKQQISEMQQDCYDNCEI